MDLAARKEEAFKKLPNEQNVGIDGKKQMAFTKSWFRYRNQKTWSTFLLPKYGGMDPVKMVQIGVFEGMDLVWCLQNILKNRESHAVAIDPWEPTRKLKKDRMNQVEANARANLSVAPGKVTIHKGFSADVLKVLPKESFDLVVVDGDHNSDAVYKDAMLSLPLLKKGGWMLFDDVRNRREKADHVQAGLDDFKADFGDRVEEVWFHRHCDCLEKI